MNIQQQVDKLRHEFEQLGYGASLAFDRHDHTAIEGTRFDQISKSFEYCARLLRHVNRANVGRAVEILRANARNAKAAQGPGESDSDNARWSVMAVVHSHVAERLEAI